MTMTNSGTERTPAYDLRTVADWLDAHPDETPSYIIVRLAAHTRKDMVRIAARLGAGATERLNYANEVDLSKNFGCVDVHAAVPLKVLRPDTPPPPPEWDRILPEPEGAVTAP